MRVARSGWSRLRGLALRRQPPDEPLLVPRCRSVHTFGMRFALDLVWLARGGRVVRVDRGVRPWRVRSCGEAIEVLELAAGRADEMMPGMTAEAPREETPSTPQTSPEEARGRMRAGFDPRRRLYRDPFNENFVFVLSASGASVIVPVLLYIVMAITGLWAVGIFVLASVALELILIFGVGRPQMKPIERVGWALLWGFSAAVLALCFYYLVADSTL
jgi:uncharacterized membrane protein (UPF0127 family)